MRKNKDIQYKLEWFDKRDCTAAKKKIRSLDTKTQQKPVKLVNFDQRVDILTDMDKLKSINDNLDQYNKFRNKVGAPGMQYSLTKGKDVPDNMYSNLPNFDGSDLVDLSDHNPRTSTFNILLRAIMGGIGRLYKIGMDGDGYSNIYVTQGALCLSVRICDKNMGQATARQIIRR